MAWRERKDRDNQHVIGGAINATGDPKEKILEHAFEECSGNEEVGAIFVQIVNKNTHRNPRWLTYTAMGDTANPRDFKHSPTGAAHDNNKTIQSVESIFGMHTNPWNFYIPGIGWVWFC